MHVNLHLQTIAKSGSIKVLILGKSADFVSFDFFLDMSLLPQPYNSNWAFNDVQIVFGLLR